MAFQKKTVFIVGAGASYEVGLPIGSELTGIISNSLRQKDDSGYRTVLQDGTLSEAIQMISQKHSYPYNALLEAARAISEAMPQAISIDNFLHTHAENDAIVLVGKLSIANAILKAEKASIIAVKNDTDQIDFRSVADSWHKTFCKILLENVQARSIEYLFDSVTFITFNYDRCIEHYMVQALKNYLRLTWGDAQELTNRLTVIHPYGQVGYLPWQSKSGPSVKFGHPTHATEIEAIASQIRTFTERMDDETTLEFMREEIRQAETLVFLGFSFGDMNMELMRIDEIGKSKLVFGTTYGVSEPNRKYISSSIRNAFEPAGRQIGEIDLPDMSCDQLLLDYWRPIVR